MLIFPPNPEALRPCGNVGRPPRLAHGSKPFPFSRFPLHISRNPVPAWSNLGACRKSGVGVAGRGEGHCRRVLTLYNWVRRSTDNRARVWGVSELCMESASHGAQARELGHYHMALVEFKNSGRRRGRGLDGACWDPANCRLDLLDWPARASSLPQQRGPVGRRYSFRRHGDTATFARRSSKSPA